MLDINKVLLTGRLTHDPESKADGSICVLQVAVNNGYYDKTQTWKDETAFLTVKVFGKAAERAEQLSKGQPVYVEGRIKQENWEQDGQKRSKLVVNAMSVKAFEVPKKGDSGDSGGGYSTSSAQTPPRGYATAQDRATETPDAATNSDDSVPW